MKNRDTYKFKLFLLHRAKKMERMRMRFKKRQKAKRRRYIGKNRYERQSLQFFDKFQDYVIIKVPRVFSLILDPNSAISFIAKVENALEKHRKVFINMLDVEILSDGALVILLSSMIKFKSNNIDFNGNLPKNKKVSESLIKSGFFEQLYETHGIKQQDSYSLSRKRIFTNANKIVDSKLSADIISYMSKLIWKEERRCLGVQRAFLELMQNTNNHAATHENGVHHWWTTINYNKEENKACFSFIDYGIGIANSINYDERSKFHRALDTIKQLFNPQSDADLLKLLLRGEIHSSTGQYYRGKGLPGIYAAYKDNKISNLIVISNKAIANVSEDKYYSLDKDFSGTFIYWELNENNKSIHK